MSRELRLADERNTCQRFELYGFHGQMTTAHSNPEKNTQIILFRTLFGNSKQNLMQVVNLSVTAN